MNWKVLMLGVAVSLCGPAWGVNKCTVGGKTVYQDAPCAGDGHKVDTTSAGPSNADVAAAAGAAAALCETALRTVPHWKDADSVRISDVKRMGFTTTKMHGTTLAVVRYGAMVEAKNSYGAYTGKKPAYCLLNGSETKVLDVQAIN